MAKKGYPGLVLVPPSDRTILRRRLLRWSLFIIALIWGASILPLWPPTSDDTVNCQPGVVQEGSNGSTEKCGQPPPVVEQPAHQSEFSRTQVSQAENQDQSKNPPSSSTHDPDQPVTEHNQGQDPKPKSSDPANRPVDHTVAPQRNEKSASSLISSNPDHNQDIDVRLADRLVIQHSHGQNSNPKSSEPVNRPTDHNVVPQQNAKSTSGGSPTLKAVEHTDVDVRLAEQGDAFAQYRLGRFYAQQNGKQAPESVHWYKKSSEGLRRLAETGNGQAMYVLGVMYAYGRGVARDTEQARRWLTHAMEQKVTAAQPVLASLETNRSRDPKPQVNKQQDNKSSH